MYRILGIVILTVVLIGGRIAYPFMVPPRTPEAPNAIVVNKATNRLYFYANGRLVETFPVATGRGPESTPEGDFRIVSKLADDDGIGKERIFGTRWLGLETPDHEDGTKYGIHGTNEPESIGDMLQLAASAWEKLMWRDSTIWRQWKPWFVLYLVHQFIVTSSAYSHGLEHQGPRHQSRPPLILRGPARAHRFRDPRRFTEMHSISSSQHQKPYRKEKN